MLGEEYLFTVTFLAAGLFPVSYMQPQVSLNTEKWGMTGFNFCAVSGLIPATSNQNQICQAVLSSYTESRQSIVLSAWEKIQWTWAKLLQFQSREPRCWHSLPASPLSEFPWSADQPGESSSCSRCFSHSDCRIIDNFYSSPVLGAREELDRW